MVWPMREMRVCNERNRGGVILVGPQRSLSSCSYPSRNIFVVVLILVSVWVFIGPRRWARVGDRSNRRNVGVRSGQRVRDCSR
jgi:hypothetical protein